MARAGMLMDVLLEVSVTLFPDQETPTALTLEAWF